MLIQDINNAVPARGFASDSGPFSAAAPKTQTAPVELPLVAVKASTGAQSASQAEQPTAAQLQKAVDDINRAMKQNDSHVEFSIDKDTKQTVIKLVESQTGELIRQFPSEEVLAISRMIGSMQHGMLIKQKA